jgi:hypothetical protein
MARDFTKNISNYLRTPAGSIGTLFSGTGFISVHAWIFPDAYDTSNASNNRLYTVVIDGSGTGNYLAIDANANPGNPKLRAGSRTAAGSAGPSALGTTNITTGSWWSVGALFDFAADQITPYVNGASDGVGAAAFDHSTWTQGTSTEADGIGGAQPSIHNAVNQFDGRMAELAFWTSGLTADEWSALGKGMSPLLIRPQSLVFYLPILGRSSPELELRSRITATVTGSLPHSDHPRVIQRQDVLGMARPWPSSVTNDFDGPLLAWQGG